MVWDFWQLNIKNFEAVQPEAASIVTCGIWCTLHDNLYCELGWQDQRQQLNKLINMYVAPNKLAPKNGLLELSSIRKGCIDDRSCPFGAVRDSCLESSHGPNFINMLNLNITLPVLNYGNNTCQKTTNKE